MTNYRRNFVPGGTYFFTVVAAQRPSTIFTDNIELLRQAFRGVKAKLPFEIVAMVVMPDHLHCIWTLPPGDTDYPTRWKKVKAAFSKGLAKNEARSSSRQSKGERGIWQRRYWEHTVRDEDDLRRHVEYIHFNPVKHGYVTKVIDWPYSTFHRFVQMGFYSAEWGDADLDLDERIGEE